MVHILSAFFFDCLGLPFMVNKDVYKNRDSTGKREYKLYAT